MSVKNSQKLKQLQTRKAKLEVDLELLDEERRAAQKRHSKVKIQLSELEKEIESLKSKEIVITEHAILRYLERVMELDIEQVKEEMLTDSVRSQIAALNNGDGKYPIGRGYKAVVKGNAIVSVV